MHKWVGPRLVTTAKRAGNKPHIAVVSDQLNIIYLTNSCINLDVGGNANI